MHINRIVGGGIIACAVGVSFFLSGCADGPPGCDAEETKQLVYQIARDEYTKRAWELEVLHTTKPILETLKLEAIRLQNQNEETKAYNCAAVLKFDATDRIGNPFSLSLDLTYTVEKTVKGDEIYVTVYGLM